MTVINNIEIDDIQYKRNIIKEAIQNNDPLDDKLHVVICISNPCLYARRYILIKEFIQRMELEETDIILYVVEYAYGKQQFIITDAKNPHHLQIRTPTPIWHKENMINVGIRNLLPASWKAVAWIDADIEFENPSWVKDTLRILNGTSDIVQLFSHAVDMNQNEETMNIFTGFGHQFVKGMPYSKQLVRFWHPGYAWACTRKAYEKMGGLFEVGILGSGDNIMALSYVKKGLKAINENSSDDYKQAVLDFQERVKNLRLGYVPGVVRHYYHGSKKNRRYHDRWQVLLKYGFSPDLHLTYDNNGVIIPSVDCPRELLDDIMQYFYDRNEDEYYQTDDVEDLVEENPISLVYSNNQLLDEDCKIDLHVEDVPITSEDMWYWETKDEDEDEEEDEDEDEEEFEDEDEEEEEDDEEFEFEDVDVCADDDDDPIPPMTFASPWTFFKILDSFLQR